MEASCWVARKIFLSPAMASSRARTLDSRPTTNGVIMYGKMTTSRIGIIGRRFVSDFSLEVSIALPKGYDADLGLRLRISRGAPPPCGCGQVARTPTYSLVSPERAGLRNGTPDSICY